LDRAALDPERRPVGRSGNTGFTQEMIPVMPAGKRLAKSVPDGSRFAEQCIGNIPAGRLPRSNFAGGDD
jgi:hypothetical protein